MELVARIAMGLAIAAGSLQVQWHQSTPVGTHSAGRLEHGVRLPPEGRAFFTWDPVLRRSPNRGWRRWGTDRLVRVVLEVARDFHAAPPRGRPRARAALGVRDRPRAVPGACEPIPGRRRAGHLRGAEHRPDGAAGARP